MVVMDKVDLVNDQVWTGSGCNREGLMLVMNVKKVYFFLFIVPLHISLFAPFFGFIDLTV